VAISIWATLGAALRRSWRRPRQTLGGSPTADLSGAFRPLAAAAAQDPNAINVE
jgi:hypothetical protein